MENQTSAVLVAVPSPALHLGDEGLVGVAANEDLLVLFQLVPLPVDLPVSDWWLLGLALLKSLQKLLTWPLYELDLSLLLFFFLFLFLLLNPLLFCSLLKSHSILFGHDLSCLYPPVFFFPGLTGWSDQGLVLFASVEAQLWLLLCLPLIPSAWRLVERNTRRQSLVSCKALLPWLSFV